MKKGLILILIFLPQLILSQKVIIDPRNETVQLDREKTIIVAKIITNEERLFQQVKSLEAEIKALNDSVQKIVNNYDKALKRIEQLTDEIVHKSGEINDLTEEQLKLEKRKSQNRLYGFALAGFNKGFRSFDAGIGFSRPKALWMIAIDPVTLDVPIIKAGVGFKIL